MSAWGYPKFTALTINIKLFLTEIYGCNSQIYNQNSKFITVNVRNERKNRTMDGIRNKTKITKKCYELEEISSGNLL